MPFKSGPAGPLPLPPALRDGGLMGDAGTSAGATSAQMDNLLRLVYQVERALDTIAKAYPQVAGNIDEVKDALTEVVAAATRKGASRVSKGGISEIDGMEL